MGTYGIIAWLIIGAIAGWLAGKRLKGSGYGLIGDIVVGIIGALLGAGSRAISASKSARV